MNKVHEGVKCDGLNSHLLAPSSDPAASVVNLVLRHSGFEAGGGGLSKDILPFPLSACPTPTEISLSLEAGRTQFDQAEGTESTLDEYLQECPCYCSVSHSVRWILFVTYVS